MSNYIPATELAVEDQGDSMFEHIVLRRAERGLPISAGQIAEALLYYQRLHIFIDSATLFQLIKQIGASGVLTLLHRPEVSAVYCEEMLGTNTGSIGVSQHHNFVAFTLAGSKDGTQLKSPVERLHYELKRHDSGVDDPKKFSKQFLAKVPIRKFSGNHFLEGGITAAAMRDVLDIDFAKKALRNVVGVTEGGYSIGENLKFEVIDTELGFYVFTDVDFPSINQRRAQATPPVEPLTIAHLLSSILEARADLALASFYGGDFVTSAATSSIIRARHEELLRRTSINSDALQHFSDVVLPDTPSLAEVIDSGERSFSEFLKLLDRASRFKDWLKTVNPDENLVRTYMRDVSSEGWIQRLPAKSIRYVITQALDATNPAVGLVAGIVDNFFLEKLLAGWRPNHFVTGKLSQFVQVK